MRKKGKRGERCSLYLHTIVADNESCLIECRAVGDGVDNLLLSKLDISI